MARDATTRYAILGALSFEAASGYGIRRWIAGSIGAFWSESFGQIYPVLRRLEREGLVLRAGAARSGRRAVLYRITPAGRRALARWAARPAAPTLLRNETLLKLFFGVRLSGRQMGGLLDAYGRAAERKLAGLAAAERIVRAEESESPSLSLFLATIRHGVLSARAQAKWVRETRRRLVSARARKKR